MRTKMILAAAALAAFTLDAAAQFKAYDNNGKAVTVPGAYFKALLWYKASSTYSFGSWTAAGFYFEHRSGASRQIMSIDELEERTGIDFFVNLPSRAGKTTADKVEAAKPGSFWN